MSLRERVAGGSAVSLPTLGRQIGDLLAIAVFVVVGEYSHGVSPLADPVVVADTFLPFAVGWLFVVGPALLNDPRVDESAPRVAVRTLAAWFVAVLLALSLRRTPLFHGGETALSEYAVFGLVAFTVGGVLLTGWRMALVTLRARRRRGPA
ncbi:MAG: DUF3054 domain-containing protein [Halorientalis sp.]